MIQTLLIFNDWALLVLRVVLALVFLAHGWPKVKSLTVTAQNFSAMGFRPGKFWGTVVAILEFFGGIALLLGFFAQLASLILALEMVVATIWKLRQGQRLVGGYELDLVLIASLLVLAASGSTLFAFDYYFQIY